ncbi:MAG: tetratricopeptide repeat protein [Nannocystaceae bacterium]|nr:tetratricopeptide repeat protein [Nannocystaceae bacterium]
MTRRKLSGARCLAATCLASALAIAPLPASAADAIVQPAGEGEASPDALSSEAVELFKQKDFDGAIAKFEAAYALDPQPNYLFNIGRVYEEKGDLANAVTYYQKFVQQPGVDLEAREAAVARLKVLKPALEEIEQKQPETKPQPQTKPAAPDPVDEAAKARRKKLRLAGYSLLGTGGGVLVIGTVFGALAVGKSNDAKDAQFIDQKLTARQEAKGRATVADALLISGGVLAGVGLILVLSTLAKPKRGAADTTATRRGRSWARRAPVLAPAVGPGQLGLAMAGRF